MASARTLIWTGNHSGDFDDALNWYDATNGLSPAASAPTSIDFVSFTGSVGGAVDLGDGAAATLRVSGGGTWTFSGSATLSALPSLPYDPYAFSINGTVTFSDVSLDASAGTGDIESTVGATLTVEGGSTVTALGTLIGNTPGQTGTLVLTGTGTTWQDVYNPSLQTPGNGSGFLTVGNAGSTVAQAGGTGYLTVTAGAALTDYYGNIGYDAGSTGTATISDGGVWTATSYLGIGVSGTGTLDIENGGTVIADAQVDLGENAGGVGAIDISAGGTLEDVGTALTPHAVLYIGYLGGSGSVTVSGVGALLDMNDRPLFLGAAAGSHGSLTIDGGGTATAGSVDIGEAASSTGVVDIEDSGSLLRITNNLRIGDAGSGTLTIGAAAEVTVGGNIYVGVLGSVIGNDGTIDPLYYENSGMTSGPLTVEASTGIINTGTFVADSGLLELNGPVSGTGTLQLGDGGTLQLDQSVASTQMVTFTATGATLDIKDPQDFSGTINGYTTGSTIAVYGIDGQPAPTYSYADGNTTVTYGNGITLVLVGTFGSSTLDIHADTTPPPPPPLPCFLAGTLIATEDGEISVDELRIGDRVRTAAGGVRPIRWIGVRTMDLVHCDKPEAVLPVRIRRDAFGDGKPRRDLYLSRDHAILSEGVLIPVKYLINGSSIRGVPKSVTVTYYHIELDRHDVVLAEGLPAESYLDTGGRAMFGNRDRRMMPHPDFGERVWESAGCAPLVITGSRVDTTRRLLAAEAAIAAWRSRTPWDASAAQVRSVAAGLTSTATA